MPEFGVVFLFTSQQRKGDTGEPPVPQRYEPGNDSGGVGAVERGAGESVSAAFDSAGSGGGGAEEAAEFEGVVHWRRRPRVPDLAVPVGGGGGDDRVGGRGRGVAFESAAAGVVRAERR